MEAEKEGRIRLGETCASGVADEEEGASGSRGSFYVFSGHGSGYVFASHGSRALMLNYDRVGAGVCATLSFVILLLRFSAMFSWFWMVISFVKCCRLSGD